MKLKTVLRKDDFQGRAFVDYIEGAEVDHDAAAAHAYKKAVALELSMPQMMAVNAMADAIMAQWGFDSGEDA